MKCCLFDVKNYASYFWKPVIGTKIILKLVLPFQTDHNFTKNVRINVEHPVDWKLTWVSFLWWWEEGERTRWSLHCASSLPFLCSCIFTVWKFKKFFVTLTWNQSRNFLQIQQNENRVPMKLSNCFHIKSECWKNS